MLFLDESIEDHEPKISRKYTTVGADHVCTVAERRVIKGIVAVCHCIFIADTYCKPIATIFFDFESDPTCSVTFFLKRRLHQTEVIVVTFCRFDHIFTDNRDAVMFEFSTEFEIDFRFEQIRVLCCFL